MRDGSPQALEASGIRRKSSCRRSRRIFGGSFAEPAGRVDRGAEIQTLVLGLLDQHDRLEGIDVVDPLFFALGGDLCLVRPVVELHLRNARDLADLTEIE